MKKRLQTRYGIIIMCFFFTAISMYSQPTLLKDIYVGPESSNNFHTFNKIGNKLMFAANDGIHGYETWLTDGTTSGTIRLSDNNIDLNDTYYYFGGGNTGQGLWKTNGTLASTVLIKDGFTQLSRLTEINGVLFFVANIDSSNMEELWKSDGTEAGTVVVKKLRPNSFFNAYTTNLIASPNGTDLLFTANDGTGFALWKSDGTTAGTITVKYFANTPQNRFGNFINMNGLIYFVAYNTSNQESLWETNGTNIGTTVVYNNLNFGSISAGNIKVYNNKIYFGAQSSASSISGNELWSTDGTFGGTSFLYDINPGSSLGSPVGFEVVNNLLVFKGNTDLNGAELWRTNGNANGTYLLNDVYPGTTSGVLNYFPTINELNKMFFTGFDGNQRMLWETDGTSAGTIPLYDISESDLPMVTNVGYINNKLIFIKETIANGKELWSLDTTTLSASNLKSSKRIKIYPNPVSTDLTIEPSFTGNYQLKVVNQLGQLVLKQIQNTSSTSLDVSNLSKGLYFLNINSENGEKQTIKFIKN
jgi:ELWxxDGT repeat protein